MLVIFLLLSTFMNGFTAAPDKNLPKKKELCLDYKSDFKITSYNVWGLPVTLPGHEDDKRFPHIADTLIKLSPDILCLQEVFSTQFRHLNLPKLMNQYYYFSDYTCNQSIVPWVQRDCHGGLATFSRFPVLEEHFQPFPQVEGMRWEEKLGAKGLPLE
ncbi:MAG: endonuclease/exonuclease/phosphatase family protein [Saprospiraceae bacterium]|nr:endonuclease/exonuclease/phosphatase family protein [Saprospiraceae bacterium]